MDSKSRLVAAVTTSGTMLCLTLIPGAGHAATRSDATAPEPLALRVQSFTDRVNAAMPVDDVSRVKLGREPGRIENVVQFFNFSNANRRRK